MNQAEKLVRQCERTLLARAATYRKCWEDARRHARLAPKTVFVHFSPDNPYVPYLGRLFEQYQEALAALKVGGYVGLRLSQRWPG